MGASNQSASEGALEKRARRAQAVAVMVLAEGVRLGPYEILAPLGAGGMGEVYRARDTRLGREVAVKVLPAHVLTAEEWRQRLQREAEAISKLAHPHVCALFDVGRQGEVDYLVMELLSGVTLAARLAKGPLPFQEVLRFGAETASALAATHAVGIAHGDLKPSNVMVTKSGIKLLDYGVARSLTPPRPSARGATWDSTVSHASMSEGGVSGTLPYMAPEQFEGKAADALTDIFALGAVLFEMATGRRAFPGASSAEVMSAVRELEPPRVSSVRPGTAPAFDALVRTCLAKRPDARWSSAKDAGLVLAQLQESQGVTPASGARRRRWALLPWGVALAALCAAAAALLVRPAHVPTLPRPSVHFLIPPPAGATFLWHPEADSIAISPDGLQVAFIGLSAAGDTRVWVRRMSQLEAHPLPTTEGAFSVFWSPDGRSIGFFARSELKRIDLPDGAAVNLCHVDSEVGQSGTWGQGGSILFASGGKVLRVPATGGVPTVAVQTESPVDVSLRNPWFLPDGESFLYLAGKAGQRALMMSAPGRTPESLIPLDSKAQYTEPGFLVFAKEGSLLAQRFDWREGRLTGAPFAIARHVRGWRTTGAYEFASSLSGTLVMQTAEDAQRLALLDFDGRELGTVAGSGSYNSFTVSPSGSRVSFGRATTGLGTFDLWSLDVERGVETRITSAPGNELFPVWLPGERALVYSVSEGELPHLVRRDLETGKELPLLPIGSFQLAQDVSPDGSSLLYAQSNLNEPWTLWRLPLFEAGTPSAVLPSGFSTYDARFSPDGRYVAFLSDESGTDEAYLTRYPGPGERLRISSGGATSLRWNRTTQTIFYSDLGGKLWSLPVTTQPALRIGKRKGLFTARSLVRRPTGWTTFDVFPDAKRIIVAVPEVMADELPLTVVVNWPASVHDMGEP